MDSSSKSQNDKFKEIISYWLAHNNEHINDIKRWLAKMGTDCHAIPELKNAIESSEETNLHFKNALNALKTGDTGEHVHAGEEHGFDGDTKGAPRDHGGLGNDHGSSTAIENSRKSFTLCQIGTIRTPYENNAPYQPIEEDEGTFQIILDPEYAEGLYKLGTFKYIFVIYLIDRVTRQYSDMITPSWAPSAHVGIFASRSPVRPNPIGISTVKVKKIEKNVIFTSGLDVFNETPLLDIKPYIKDLDSKKDANFGWVEELNGWEHMILHLKGIPHDY